MRNRILIVGTGLGLAVASALSRESHRDAPMVIRHREEVVPMKLKPLYFQRKRHPKKDYSLKSVSKGRK